MRSICIILLLSIGLSFISPMKTNAQSTSKPKAGVELLQADDLGMTVRFTLGEYQISKVELDGQQFDRIELTDSGRTGESGKPNLPLVAEMIGVPADANFQVTIVSSEREELNGSYYIEPAGSYTASSEDFSPGELSYVVDNEAYSSQGEYPGKLAELGEAAWLRDQRIVPLRFYPFQYQPAERKLSLYTSITVRIDFQYPYGLIRPSQSTALSSNSSSPFESVYQDSLLNYDQAKAFRARAPITDKLKPMSAGLNEASGNPRYKITITEDGIYRITYETLQSIGFPVDTIDPQTFSMTNQGRPVAIYVDDSGHDPAKFQPGEFILFYGQHFDGTYLASLYADEANQWRKQFTPSGGISWSPQFNHTMMEKYTDQNVYWLSYGDGNTFLMETGMPATANCYEVFLPLVMKNSTQKSANTSGIQMSSEFTSKCHPKVATTFREKIHIEPQLVWRTTHFTSEDTFFWDWIQIYDITTKTYTVNIPNPAQSINTANIRGEFVGYSNSPSVNPDHHEILYLNDTNMIQPIADLSWDGLIKYIFDVQVTQNKLLKGQNSIQIKYTLQPDIYSENILFNWLEIQYDRLFIAENNQLEFSGDIFGTWQYNISGFTSQKPWLMDVTYPLNPILLTGTSFSNGVLTFEMTHRQNEKFIAANSIDLQANQITLVTPTNDLLQPADYIFITHPDFLESVQQLANYRTTHDNLKTKVVNINDLYNEFNYGIYHPIAIKNYLNYIYHTWDTPPLYVLLIGDGHWNFQGSPNYDNPKIFMPPNLSWIDPWQGEVDSSSLLAAVNGNDPLPDISIGRLPVQSSSQVESYLQKVIAHENKLNEAWQKTNTFIADKPDPYAGDFAQISKNLIRDYIAPVTNPKWFYLNSGNTYDTESATGNLCTVTGNRYCWNATQGIISFLNSDGGGILNYTGHGAINIWTKSTNLILSSDINSLTETTHQPIVLSWTCLDGYWYYPKNDTDISQKRGQSLIELMLRSPNKGLVAAFSATGLGVSTGHDYLARGFYKYITHMDQNQPWRLGMAVLNAKINLYQKDISDIDLISTYTIFGDPALLTAAMPAP